jgi:hypothetical protein
MTNEDDKRMIEQGHAQFASIVEMVDELRKAREAEDDSAIEEAEQTIREDALSVEVRSNWHTPGAGDAYNEQFRILLCTGGPACQIIGNLGEHDEPEEDSLRIEVQDWFKPWTEVTLTELAEKNSMTRSEAQAVLLDYCMNFYYGEG